MDARTCGRISFLSLVLFALAFGLPSISTHAACLPAGTSQADTIVCSDADTQGVVAGSGDDRVTVLSGATVNVQVSDPVIAPIAIDAGAGADTVLNFGTVTLSLASGSSATASARQCHVAATSNAARGIFGAGGGDYLSNFGTIDVSSLYRATSAASAPTGTQCSFPASAAATGIEGGDAPDHIINAGAIHVAATIERQSVIGLASGAGLLHYGPPPTPGAVTARAAGMIGGGGFDHLDNDGTLMVTATSTMSGSAAYAAGMVDGSSGGEIINHGTLKVTATGSEGGAVQAIGIAGSNGKDVIENHGTLETIAITTLVGMDLSLSLSGGDETIETTVLESKAVGIDAGNGKDKIVNSGDLNASATTMLLTGNLEQNLLDTSHGDTSTSLRAEATGIAAGNGADAIAISNDGTVSAHATSLAGSLNIEVNTVDAATADSTLELEARAKGIDSGRGQDSVSNAGSIEAVAGVQLLEFGVNASFVDLTILDRQGSNMSSTLNAFATGIDSAQGKDTLEISHAGTLTARANSSAVSVGVSLASEGVPGSTQTLFETGALASIGITSNSETYGITTGSAKDRLNSAGDITSTATSSATQASINVGVAIFDFKLPTPGLVLGSAGTAANAGAHGIDTGQGNDVVLSTGKVDVDSTASATAATASLNIAELSVDLLPGVPGLPVGASLVVADTATEAHARASGIATGAGNDTLGSEGAVDANATATGGSVSVAATLNTKFKEGDNFFTLNAVVARGVTTADADAVGLDGGSGDDAITNANMLTVGAKTDTYAVAAGVDVAGTVRGAGGAASLALTDSSSLGTATAAGILGGEGDDEISNMAGIAATADADVVSVSGSVTVGIAKKGLAVGAALARSESIANAHATGIDAGAGADDIDNGAAITSMSTADADSISVSATISGATQGLVGGVALVDAGSTANATATGIQTGIEPGRKDEKQDGWHKGCNDCASHATVTNAASITADAKAETVAVGVSAEVGIVTKEGAALGAALARSSATANSLAAGIVADGRDDVITNVGPIGLRSIANADAVSVSLTVEGVASGLAAGAALVDASVNANAAATGIEAGAGRDKVVNTGTLGTLAGQEIASEATAVGVSVGATLTVKEGAALGVALADTSATAITTASGIAVGAGDDAVFNVGDIGLTNIKANADAISVSLEVALAKEGLAVGAALANSDSSASSTATGIDGGSGDDLLVNDKSILLQHVRADADAVSVGVTLAGAKDGVALGAALVDADATAGTSAVGLAGGDGRDTLINQGSVTLDDIHANADATGVSVGFTFAKEGLAIAAALAETGANSGSGASGLVGGAGNDEVFNEGSVALTNVRAEADAVSVTVGLAGAKDGVAIAAALADASGTAVASARGIEGGSGDDLVINRGQISASGITADGDASSISVELAGVNAGVAAGVTIADTSATARATAIGIEGGEGADELWNKGGISLTQVRTDADAVSVGVTLNAAISGGVAAGAALGRSTATSEARAIGMSGGAGDDWLANKGTITIDGVVADTSATGVTAELGVTNAGAALGAALADTSASAHGFASGLEGGLGDDRLINSGAILLRNIKADADAVSVSVGLNAAISGGVAAGVALTDGSGTADVRVRGLAGEAGDDLLVNAGTISSESVEADAHATGVSVEVNASMAGLAAGVAVADTSATAGVDVIGMEGGDGDDVLYNHGTVDMHGKAKADAFSMTFTISGAVGVAGAASISDASGIATASVRGLDAGSGRDEIVNEGAVTAGAEAVSEATAVSVAISVGVGGGAALGDARSTASAEAIGIHSAGDTNDKSCGGERRDQGSGWHDKDKDCRGDHGHDDPTSRIINSGTVTATATSSSDGTSVTVNLGGLSLGETTNLSTANATGIKSGDARDKLHNAGAITATSSARAESLAVSVGFFGESLGDASSTARAEAAAIDTGAGDDEIDNLATLAVDARSYASADTVSVGLIGVIEADASNTAMAAATGIRAGSGDDRVWNDAVMNVAAGNPLAADGTGNCTEAGGGACAQAFAVSVGLFGLGSADASSIASAGAVGISGGAGNDIVQNTQAITATSLARGKAQGIGVTLFGASDVAANTTAHASAIGLAGDGGNDQLINAASLNVRAGAESWAKGLSVTLFGAASASADTFSTALGVGIDGGADHDVVVNTDTGNIDVYAKTQSVADASSWNFAGAASAAATLGALTDSYGIRGGSGSDWIENAGGMKVETYSDLNAYGKGVNIFGKAAAGTQITASASATGIDAGDDDDVVRNMASIQVISTGDMYSHATTFSLIGGSSTDELITAGSTSVGIHGGGGNNQVVNRGLLDVQATSLLTATGGASVGIAGEAKSVATVASNTTAVGISTGDGDDEIASFEGSEVIVTATASPTADTDSSAGIYFSNGIIQSTAVSSGRAYGLSTGAGQDSVWNGGNIGVKLQGKTDSDGTATADEVSNYLGIDVDAYATTTARLGENRVYGILAGDGDKWISNHGAVSIESTSEAEAYAFANGQAIASGDGEAYATGRADGAYASGIEAGDGDNWIHNSGTLSVGNYVHSDVDTDSDADGIGEFREPDSLSTSEASANNVVAVGIRSGQGGSAIFNKGDVTVSAAPVADADADADHGGDVLGIDTEARTSAEANGVRALGIWTGDGGNWVWNKEGATITVTAAPQAIADSFANGTGWDGDAGVRALANADNALAVGIQTGDGDDAIKNEGTIEVVAKPSADTRVISSPGCDLLHLNCGENEFGNGDAPGQWAKVKNASAVGIAAGGGNDWITNRGTLLSNLTARTFVEGSAPRLESSGTATGIDGGEGDNRVRNEGRIEASALVLADDIYDANPNSDAMGSARGIWVGNGLNDIVNSGEIQVNATARASVEAKFNIFGIDFTFPGGDADSAATGIQGGHGGNMIVNEGAISVVATARGDASKVSAAAYGIQTGDGDDTIINKGTIDTRKVIESGDFLGVLVTTESLGTAIASGGGNDTVVLGDGSVTNGDIDLGAGADTLSLEGTPVINGNIVDSLSAVTLMFNNSGSYAKGLPGASAIKNGEGTFTLSMLNPMERIEVNRGTLRLTRDYQFLPEGLLQARVHGDGAHGQFLVDGRAGLDGKLKVVRGEGAYVDGRGYEVLKATGGFDAGTAFSDIELPAPTRLVGFHAEQLADAFKVEAEVASFTTVAAAGNDALVGQHLDRILPDATGDLNAALGEIQSLSSDAEFATAFSSLSPAVHEAHSRASLSSQRQYGQTLQERMTALRVSELPAPFSRPVRVAYDGSATSLWQLLAETDADKARPYGVWLKAFAAQGRQDARRDTSGYEHDLAGLALGIDRRFSGSLMAGVSVAQARNEVQADIDRSDADIDSTLFALYGSYLDNRLYANGTLSFGRNDYDTRRVIVVGPTSTPVTSTHRGDVLGVGLGLGYYLRAGESWVDPFLNLQYTRLAEDGFSENGSGAGLVVAERTTRAFVSTLGVRWLRTFSGEGGATWSPEASLAWLHDFDRGGHAVNAAYVGAPDASFSIDGQPVERNGTLLGLGVSYRASDGLSTFLRYTGEFRSHYTAHGLIGELRYEF